MVWSRNNRKHPDKPITPLEIEIGKELKKSPWMIRFYGYRLGLEITLGRMLTHEEQCKLTGVIMKEIRRKWGKKKNE